MTEEKKQVNTKEFEAGWNDPPVFTYESQEANRRQCKSKAFNKRVVFPISSLADSPKGDHNSDGEQLSRISSSSPPKFHGAGPARIVVKSFPTCSTPSEWKASDEAHVLPALDVVLNNFNDSLYEVYFREDSKEAAEIKRRLAIMERMWNDGKFNVIIQEKLFKLSMALQENRLQECESLQRNLMVDHTNVCSLWMAGIRKLIYRKMDSSNL